MGSNLQNYSIFSDQLESIEFEKRILINTINQYSFMLAENDKEFMTSLMGSDVLLPDGVGIVVATKLLKGQKIKKIAGADIHHYFLEKMNREGGRCFYLGSSLDTLKKIEERLTTEYPGVKFSSYSPPFRTAFTDGENAEMINSINEFKPDVLFVGMTAPKQEKWSYLNKNKIDAKAICCIGAVFDFYAGTVARPNSLLINLGFEWLGRLIKEPKRVWRRYLYFGPAFIYLVLKEKLNNSFLNPNQEKKSFSNNLNRNL